MDIKSVVEEVDPVKMKWMAIISKDHVLFRDSPDLQIAVTYPCSSSTASKNLRIISESNIGPISAAESQRKL